MAGTKGGLFSLDAKGSVAKTIVFSRWKGRQYVRQHVTPANPQTPLQKSVRAVTSFCSKEYPILTASEKTLWTDSGQSEALTGMNMMVRKAQAQRIVDKGPLRVPAQAPGSAPGPPTGVVATAARKQVTLTWVNSVTGTLFATEIYMATTTGFTAAPANLVKMLVTTNLTIVITGLVTGQAYFFRIRHSEPGGVLGTLAAEVTATPT